MNPWWYFELAAKAADRQDDLRAHRVGAIGLRADGVMVVAANGPAKMRTPQAHAEARLCRKLDFYGTVFVARRNIDGYALAKPCPNCETVLQSRRVKRVYYTISNNEYGVLDL
jgi:tRNA(Arg) A34 adenosine deaminase TadA